MAEGAPVSGGYIGVPLYGEPVFQNHGFFAGRWPVKEMGLTKMDFSQHKCAEAESILATGIRVTIDEHMTEDYMLEVAAAIQKVDAILPPEASWWSVYGRANYGCRPVANSSERGPALTGPMCRADTIAFLTDYQRSVP